MSKLASRNKRKSMWTLRRLWYITPSQVSVRNSGTNNCSIAYRFFHRNIHLDGGATKATRISFSQTTSSTATTDFRSHTTETLPFVEIRDQENVYIRHWQYCDSEILEKLSTIWMGQRICSGWWCDCVRLSLSVSYLSNQSHSLASLLLVARARWLRLLKCPYAPLFMSPTSKLSLFWPTQSTYVVFRVQSLCPRLCKMLDAFSFFFSLVVVAAATATTADGEAEGNWKHIICSVYSFHHWNAANVSRCICTNDIARCSLCKRLGLTANMRSQTQNGANTKIYIQTHKHFMHKIYNVCRGDGGGR